ncbi:MAG TPA: hypothetical protein HPP77_10290 [Candidatus Hydrogenedentes bacterium]|nr:hypothetical protein [Candidatus Hydrogenedentota bacterium]HIJ74335.1 hypothetical protein [Candidatus Hydrogenedentota bacterium]
MIEITLTQALAFYGAILGGFAVIVWTYTEIAVRRRYRVLEQQFLWRCVFCGYIYLDEAAETISKCPRCESLNALTDRHARFIHPRAKHPEAEASRQDVSSSRKSSSHRKRPHQRHRGPRHRRR